MVRATLRITVRPGAEQEFPQVWKGIAEQVRTVPGNLRQTLQQQVDQPRCFVIVSDWTDAAAFRAFERSPEQDALTQPIRRLREDAEMHVYAVLEQLEGTDQPCSPE
jgi:heme-degrading monooxygenase HmoA